MERHLALIVERSASTRDALRNALESRGLYALSASSSKEALETLGRRPVRVLVADGDAPGSSGEEIVQRALSLTPMPVVVLMTEIDRDSHETEALLGDGVYDVLTKPLCDAAVSRLAIRLKREVECRDRLRELEQRLQEREGFDGLVGRGDAMSRLRGEIEQLAQTSTTLWFQGEEGAGKESCARHAHACSDRADGPFVVVDCASSEASRLEYLWVQAEGGTLFLHRPGEFSIAAQEVLRDRLSRPETPRLMVGSRRDPRHAVEEGSLQPWLQEDLEPALLNVPALRERLEDIPFLVRSFLDAIVEINRLQPIEVDRETTRLLQSYGWPGNVQELRNAIEHAAILANQGALQPTDLPERILKALGGGSTKKVVAALPFKDAKRDVVQTFEHAYLSDLMERNNGNVTAASQHAGMLRSALQRLLRKYGLKSAVFRQQSRNAALGKAPSTEV